MTMTWTAAMMSPKKMEQALVAAGIDPRSDTWTPADMLAAERVLNAAQQAHLKGRGR